MNVYFISGMSASCKVFDNIKLPDGFDRQYIEWIVPSENESLEEYVRSLAKTIDTAQPFVLVGYSLGGIMVQEMNKFLSPQKTILIASIKSEDELTPFLYKIRKERIANNLSASCFDIDQFTIDLLPRLVYGVVTTEVSDYVSCTDPVYTRWAITQLINWQPSNECANLFHIHGNRDQIFPSQNMSVTHLIDGGDHLMVTKRPKKIEEALAQILQNNID